MKRKAIGGRGCRAAMVFAAMALAAPELAGQRAVTLQISPNAPSPVEFRWQSGSVVPPPGFPIFPDYQAYRSGDLTNWMAMGERFPGGIGATNRVFSVMDPVGDGSMAFYRVESIVDLSFADLIGENLKRADFRGANLFGADLFAADLEGADLEGAILSAADLRFATLTNTTLQGADLFATKLFGAVLGGADLTGADASFANLGT
ncbi:MAG TPA: pentapeptide repeat-containing protein, partial [Verrucomicrobiae bacterium]|nr:pentapeptide repeat-containing protein [Verrucomicrobiae bacterium]